MSVRSRASSESSIGFRNGTFRRSILCPELREHGDQERVRDEDGRQDAERAADTELRDEVEPEERETRYGDGDGETREDHRAPGRRTRFGCCVARR